MMTRNHFWLAALFLACCLTITAHSRAGDAPAVVISRVSVGSASQVAKLADDLGVPLPAMFTAAGVEQMFPFLGQQGLNPDLPLTLDFISDGSKLTTSQRQIWYLPVNPGKAPIDTFQTNGEKMGDDGALVNGTPFRRTADYLMFGGTQAAMTAIHPADMVKAFSDHPLFYIEYSPAKLRQSDPNLLSEMKKSSEQNTKEADNPGELVGQQFATHFMFDVLDKAVFRINRTASALRMSSQIQPALTFTAKTWTPTGMPEGLAARADWQMPAGIGAAIGKWIRTPEGDKLLSGNPSADTPEKKDAFATWLADAIDAFFGGEQCSIGLAKLGDNGSVVYLETQAATPRNAEEDCQRIIKDLGRVDGKKEEIKSAVWFTHTGVRIQRMFFNNNDGDVDFIADLVDVKNKRLITCCKTENTEMEKLLAAKSTGAPSTGASGWVDLPALLAMRSCFGKPSTLSDVEVDTLRACDLIGSCRGFPLKNAVFEAVFPIKSHALSKVLANQRLNWTIGNERDQLNMSMDLPIPLLKNIITNAPQLMELVQKLKGN